MLGGGGGRFSGGGEISSPISEQWDGACNT